MKQLFSALAALIFLFQHLRNPVPKAGQPDELDIFAPLTGMITHIGQELIIAVIIAAVITFAISALLGRWR